jgi:hypothetical protein
MQATIQSEMALLQKKIDGLRKRLALGGLSLMAFANLHIDLAHAERSMALIRKNFRIRPTAVN